LRSIHSSSGPVGHRVGAGGRPGEPPRALANSAPRVEILFVCSRKHETVCNFAESAAKVIPATWPCPNCGASASRGNDPGQAPPPEHGPRHAEHLMRVKDRRSPEQAAEILQWATERLHEARRRDQAHPGHFS